MKSFQSFLRTENPLAFASRENCHSFIKCGRVKGLNKNEKTLIQLRCFKEFVYIIIFFQNHNFECFKSPFINHQMELLQSFQVVFLIQITRKKRRFCFVKLIFKNRNNYRNKTKNKKYLSSYIYLVPSPNNLCTVDYSICGNVCYSLKTISPYKKQFF